MRKRKMLIGVLTAAMLLGNVSPAMVQGAQAAEVTEVPAETETEELATESAVAETEGEETTENAVTGTEEEETTENVGKTVDAQADENGFIIEDGVLTGYTGPGGDVVIPEGVISVDSWAFRDCKNIVRMCLPKSFTGGYYPLDFLDYCENLEWIDVAEGNMKYQSINGFLCSVPYKENEFIEDAKNVVRLEYCPSGKTGDISIPEGVTRVYNGEFTNCKKITSITIPASVEVFEKGVWEDRVWLYEYGMLNNYYVADANPNYKSIDGVVYSKDGSTLVAYPIVKGGNVVVSNNVKKIEDFAFSACVNLNKVILPESVKSIGIGAFESAQMLEIALPSGITEIDHWTFNRCRIPEIIIPEGVKEIKQHALGVLCSREDYQPVNIIIPSSVENISGSAFEYLFYVFEEHPTVNVYCKQGSVAEKAVKIAYNDNYKYNLMYDQPPTKRYAGIVVPDFGEITYGDKPFSLNAYTNSDATLLYRSDNENVAQVDANGVVTIKGYGSANITISAPETDNYYSAPERYVYIHIHGKGEEQTITAPGAITKTYGDPDFPIGAVTDGDGKLSYYSSDESVARIDVNGMVTLTGAGVAWICVAASETETYEETSIIITIDVRSKKEEANTPSDTETTENTETKPDTGTTENTEKKPEHTTNTNNNSNLITAKNITKTYGCKAFSIGAKSKSGGKLTYSVADKKVAVVDKKGKVTVKGYGQTKITITLAAKGKYPKAKKTITLTVKPVKTKIASVKSTKSKNMVVKWKKDTKASGYVIQYSTDKKFKKGVKTVTITKNKTTSKTIGKLKGGKNYYVRVCTYKKSNGKQIKGSYSAVKSIKVKK